MVQKTLSSKDQEAIASLANHPGYVALLKVLENYIEALQDDLMESDNPEKEKRLLSLWKAVRTIYQVFRTFPQEIASTIDAEAKEINEMLTTGNSNWTFDPDQFENFLKNPTPENYKEILNERE